MINTSHSLFVISHLAFDSFSLGFWQFLTYFLVVSHLVLDIFLLSFSHAVYGLIWLVLGDCDKYFSLSFWKFLTQFWTVSYSVFRNFSCSLWINMVSPSVFGSFSLNFWQFFTQLLAVSHSAFSVSYSVFRSF